MTPIMFVYKSIRKVWRMLIQDPFCHVATSFIMYCNGVQHGSFRTNGIPIFNTYRKSKGKIVLADNLRMNNGKFASRIGFIVRCTFTVQSANIYIRENVGMSQTIICAVEADITIGRNTLLGSGVKIYSSNFHSLNYMDRRSPKTDHENRKTAPVIIGEDCFIGAGTIILKGVTIGDRTIIGAGSVVTKSIPADCIAAGNPCKVISEVRNI